MTKSCFAPLHNLIAVFFLPGSFMALERALRHLQIATMTHSEYPA